VGSDAVVRAQAIPQVSSIIWQLQEQDTIEVDGVLGAICFGIKSTSFHRLFPSNNPLMTGFFLIDVVFIFDSTIHLKLQRHT